MPLPLQVFRDGLPPVVSAAWLNEIDVTRVTLPTTAGAGLSGFSSSVTYPANTVGAALRSIVGAQTTAVSIAALRLLSKLIYSQAFVTGYYTAGDGGGGSYWYDAADTTSADNGGTIIVASDGARWKLIYTDYISVRQFGAKGDGTTNDTAAFAAAIAVFANGGTVLVPRTSASYLLAGGSASPDGFKNGILFPFTTINSDQSKTVILQGMGGTILKCGADNLILIRISRNCVTIRDLIVDFNSHTSVYLIGIVPEDMTQVITQVSQSYVNVEDVNRIGGAGVEGLVIQPGPTVAASDSGCFYHNISGGASDFPTGGRHVWLKKNADWASNPRRPTRINFSGQRLLRGNTGYHLDVGSEIDFFGCNEELISTGVTPNGTPTARYIGDDVTSRIMYYGGYSEACTRSTRTPTGGKVISYGYSFNSAPDVNEFAARAVSYDSDVIGHVLTPVLVGSGGGAQGATTSTGYSIKQGNVVTFFMNISAGIGTLAGDLSVSGLQSTALGSSGNQWAPVVTFAGVTLAPAANTVLGALISSVSIALRKSRNDGAASVALTVAECGATVAFTIQGTYIAA